MWRRTKQSLRAYLPKRAPNRENVTRKTGKNMYNRKDLRECSCDVVSHRTCGGAEAAVAEKGEAGASLHCVHLW